MAANDLDINIIKQRAQELRDHVIASINKANNALHAIGGVGITIQNFEKQIQTLVRDATQRTSQQKIDWIFAYQMRTLSFLMTAITLVEIHSEHANSAEVLKELDALLPQITDPSLWNPEEKAKENFSHYVKEMSSTLKRIDVAEKSFYYANGWVSVDLPSQIIETKSTINGTNYISRSEPICELTRQIKLEFARILKPEDKYYEDLLPIWYRNLDKEGQKLCAYYAEKIAKGELHQLTPGLRGLIPGLKNAYKTTLIREGKEGEQDKELLSFYHTATVPMGSETLDIKENITLTELDYQAMRGASEDIVVYTTLVSRHGDSIQDKIHTAKVVENCFKNLVGSDPVDEPKRPELIDHVIHEISKQVAKRMQEKGLPFYHTNVCLNGARRFESPKVEDLNKVLAIIEQKIKECQNVELKAELWVQLEEAKKEVHALSEQAKVMVFGDDEMRAYKGLFAFAKLVHNYNQNKDVNQGVQVRWYFGCASGQNRTQALSYNLMNQAICADQRSLKSRDLNQTEMDEIPTRLAEDGHFAYINGPYDAKFGIRSKSAGSFPKSLFRAIQAMILSLADTKRPNDVLFEPLKRKHFFEELNKKSSLSRKQLISIWEKYVHGKSGIALNDIELLGVVGELMKLNQRHTKVEGSDNKYAFFLRLAFREQRLEFLFCQQDNKYKNIFSFMHALDNALGKLESSELPKFVETFFRSIKESEESMLTVNEAYRLLLVVYSESNLIDVIHAAYKNRDKIELQLSREGEADSEGSYDDIKSDDLAEFDDNSTPLRKEETVASIWQSAPPSHAQLVSRYGFLAEKSNEEKSNKRKSNEEKSNEKNSNERKSNEEKSNERKSNERKSNERKSNEEKSNEEKSNERNSNERKSNEEKSNEKKSNQARGLGSLRLV